MVVNKPILEQKVQALLPLEFVKDNQPQSSTSANLSFVLNPVFRSNDLVSINPDVEKQISLLKLQLAENESQKQEYAVRKNALHAELLAVGEANQSNDLATKERAVKELPTLERAYNSLHAPADNSRALLTRLTFLEQKLHVRKTQSISGYISYITFK